MTTTELKLWQAIQRHYGLRPDGIPGINTARAVANGLGVAPVVSPASRDWPRDTEAEMRAFYGEIGTGHTQIVPPYPLFYEGRALSRITVHSKVAEAVMEVLTVVLRHYGGDEIKRLKLDVFDGCYNPRRKRGGTSWSVHAYAAAFDFCAEDNAMSQDHRTARFAKPEYVPWFEAWESVGAISLGRERDYDYMHTQLARL